MDVYILNLMRLLSFEIFRYHITTPCLLYIVIFTRVSVCSYKLGFTFVQPNLRANG